MSPVVRVMKFVSGSFHVDRKRGSMQGPVDVQSLLRTQLERPEILWLTGYRASVIPADGAKTIESKRRLRRWAADAY